MNDKRLNVAKIEKIFLKNKDLAKAIMIELIVKGYKTKLYNKQSRIKDERVSSNPEFENFFQSIYHAGTLEQFILHSHMMNNLLVMNTFLYMFDVFKKGIFVRIKDNNIVTYLPFSKYNYRNDWGHNLKTENGGYKDVVAFEEKNHYNPHFVPEKYHTMIQRDPTKWYANYNIFRNEIYKNGKLRLKTDEGDKSVENFLYLLSELCYERKIPDVYFFISPRDFPIVRKNMYHPYDRLYPKGKVPYLGDKYEINTDIVPIFSQSITDEYDDILIPNDDDIVNIIGNKYEENLCHDWHLKKNVAVFRGSATGCGVTPEDNQRLKLIDIAIEYQALIDAKLISLNRKLKINSKGVAVMIDKNNYPNMNKEYKEKYFLNSKAQSEYKYIIHVKGHVSAFRLSRELSYKSLILKVSTDFKTWYSDKLIGCNPLIDPIEHILNSHYVNIKKDLSNLIKVINWCKENDGLCKKIAENSYKFWELYLKNKGFMFNYMQNKLKKYSNKQVKM
jgi:hypothetical protein